MIMHCRRAAHRDPLTGATFQGEAKIVPNLAVKRLITE